MFILGSGVSVDHKYPTGKKLLEDIINVLDEKISIYSLEKNSKTNVNLNKTYICVLLCYNYVREHKTNPWVSGDSINQLNEKIKEYYAHLERFHEKLKNAYPRSIDDFIHSQTATEDQNANDINREIGKLLIVLILTCYEEKSLAYNQSNEGLYQVTTTFFTDFWGNIYGSNFDEFIENINKTQFITFNYDRLLEHFIYSTATSFFATTPDQNEKIKEFLSNNILHIYGMLPKMEWQDEKGFQYGTINLKNLIGHIMETLDTGSGFGENQRTDDINRSLLQLNQGKLQKTFDFILEASKSIKTYSEEIDPNLIENMKAPDQMYFLGFSFHKLNIKRLKKILNMNSLSQVPKIHGSFFGMKYNEFLEARLNVNAKILPKTIGPSWELDERTFPTYNKENFDKLSKYKIPDLFRSQEKFRYLSK